ncbi:MAG: lipoyl(octanoyl) transferase LipB [Dichotomicrobium sp.]
MPAETLPDTEVEWAVSRTPVDYERAMAAMDARVRAIREGRATELVWLLEHPPLYTAGTSARRDDLLVPDRFPVYETGRGGQYTYHGPGQRVAYVMLDLSRRRQDVRWFVTSLEAWLIATLAAFGVRGERRDGLAGVWVARLNGGAPAHAKIAALGVRLRRWVSFHGISLNVAPDLSHFSGIVPCGVSDAGVTSLSELGAAAHMREVDTALRAAFERQFACRTVKAPAPLGDVTQGLPSPQTPGL